MNNAPMEPCLQKEAVSVAAVPLESFLREKAAPVPNVPQEKSRRLQAAVRAKLALPERTKSTSKFATGAPKAKFLQSQVAQLAAGVTLAVLQKRP